MFLPHRLKRTTGRGLLGAARLQGHPACRQTDSGGVGRQRCKRGRSEIEALRANAA